MIFTFFAIPRKGATELRFAIRSSQHRSSTRFHAIQSAADAFAHTSREILPYDHPDALAQIPDGHWVCGRFYHFSCDLNHPDPAVFRAIAVGMLFPAMVSRLDGSG